MSDAIRELIKQWKIDVKGYPPSENGLLAKAVVQLCIKELEEAVSKEKKN